MYSGNITPKSSLSVAKLESRVEFRELKSIKHVIFLYFILKIYFYLNK